MIHILARFHYATLSSYLGFTRLWSFFNNNWVSLESGWSLQHMRFPWRNMLRDHIHIAVISFSFFSYSQHISDGPMSGHQFGDLTGLTVTVTLYRLRQVLFHNIVQYFFKWGQPGCAKELQGINENIWKKYKQINILIKDKINTNNSNIYWLENEREKI